MDTNNLMKIAINFERQFLALQEAFLPSYYTDNRIALIDDCWKYVRREFETQEEDDNFADNHLCGHAEKETYNISAALRIIVDLYKEIFNEIINSAVSELAKATEKDFRENSQENSQEKIENSLKDICADKLNIPILRNPFATIADVYFNWNAIAERMDKHDYSRADNIYIKAEQRKRISDEDMKEYNDIMVPFIKQSFKDLGQIADSLDIQIVRH